MCGCVHRHRLRILPPVPDEIDECNGERGYDQSIDLATRLRRDGGGAIDVLFELEPFRRHFERPCEEQGDRQAQQQDDDEGFENPLRRTEVLEGKLGNLGKQPRNDDVGNAYAHHVAPLELRDQPHTCPQKPEVAAS